MADLDCNSRPSLISGSWPGEISAFRRNSDGSFAGAESLKNEKGAAFNLGHGSSVFACDWYGDGRMGLIVGSFSGDVFFVPRAPGKSLRFGPATKLTLADGKPLHVRNNASPIVADWDADGKLDLMVGAEDGSVVWFRTIGTRKKSKLDAARVPKSPTPFGYDPKPNEWGTRAKPSVLDWSGDGRLSLIVGDCNGYFKGKPTQAADEKAEEKQANDDLPKPRRAWADAFGRWSAPPKHPRGTARRWFWKPIPIRRSLRAPRSAWPSPFQAPTAGSRRVDQCARCPAAFVVAFMTLAAPLAVGIVKLVDQNGPL